MFKIVSEKSAQGFQGDPLDLLDYGREADYICFIVSKGVPSEHDRLYYRTDYVRVYEQLAIMKAAQA